MQKLKLLFTESGIESQLTKAKNVLEEKIYLENDETPEHFLEDQLVAILDSSKAEALEVVSAINHFSITPEDFSQHDLGKKLVSYNASIVEVEEELMLSINKKMGIQFYYTFPKKWYVLLKSKNLPIHFNFSGEKFLNKIQVKHAQEIHINLYHHQVEFFAFENKKIVLYNNLDVDSEVDFLYFIMFTMSKLHFGINETYFYIYGETSENDTFISELRKFAKHINIVFDNISKKKFIFS